MAGLQGKIFSGYQLAEQVNGGGIADVYRAQPTSRGGRPAIVKVIHPEFAQQKGFLPHFREIVKLSKRLANHPHILPLLASGEESGYLYLVTPFVASGTLKDWIARGERLGASDTGPFFRQLCDALGYAHSLGIVHSNIKPSNIFLFEGRHVLLGDFGMLWDIRMFREFAQMDVTHSAEAVEYLAPEVANNQATQLSDIYSVGAVLFAAITGQAPFRGATLGEVLSAHEHLPPPHLQQANSRLAPAMQALDGVTQRALAKRPQDRFASAAALSQAIETTLSQAPLIQASPMTYPPGMPQMTQRPQDNMRMGGSPSFPGGAPAAGGGPMLQALNPPFPPLPSPEMVDGTMEHGRITRNPSPTEAPTGRVPAPGITSPVEPSDQSTLHFPAPDPTRSPPRVSPQMPHPPAAAEQSAGGWSNAASGDAGILPAIRASDLGSIAAKRDSAAAPGAPPGFQPGYQRYDGPGDGARTNGWGPDSADNDSAAWEKLNSQRYAAVNPSDPYLGDSETDGYRAPNGWGDEYTGEYSSEYTGTGYAMGEDSRELDSWTSEGPRHSPTRDERGFSPTQLGLPRLTNPSLGADLPSPWQDIVSGALPPPVKQNGWERAEPRNGAIGSSGWSEGLGYSESLPEYSGQTAQPEATEWPQTSWPETSEWQELESGGNNRRSLGAPPIPFEEQRIWTTGTAALGRRSRWATWLIPIILLLVLASSGYVAVMRPNLCPAHSCQAISAKVHKLLPFLSGSTSQPAASLSTSPGVISLHVATGKLATTTLTLTNAGPGVAHWTAASGFSWLTLDSTSGTLVANGSVTLTLTADSSGLHSGPYTTAITITSDGHVIPIPVTVTVTAS
ncbi:MAG: protein kinase domain-containing protein [Ktedonobacterales bacterium]